MNQLSVSILIPLYNGIEFLPECIKSVQNQIYTNWEIIIGINGHHEHSQIHNIAKTFSGPKITVKWYPSKGKPNTMNLMVAVAKYDTVCILDVDDYWHPNKLQQQVNVKHMWDIVGTQCYYVRGNTVTKQKPKIPVGKVTEFFSCNPMINSSVMMNKRDAVFEDVFLDDYALWFRLQYENKSFYNLPTPLVYHRLHSGSHFNGTNNKFVKELRNKWRQFKK